MWVMDHSPKSSSGTRQSIKASFHFIVGISNKAVYIDDPKVYHKEIYNLHMSHWRRSEFGASMLPAAASVLTSPLITKGAKFCILRESCTCGVREVPGGHWIYERAGLGQINSRTLLTHVPGLTLPLGVRNFF